VVKVGFQRINLSNAVFLILALLLLALPAITYYTPPKPAYAGIEIKDLLNLFVEALQGLNRSTKLLSSAIKGLPVNVSGHIRRMRVVGLLARAWRRLRAASDLMCRAGGGE